MCRWVYPVPRVTTERERRNTTKWIRAASLAVLPLVFIYLGNKQGKKSRNSKERRWLWMTGRGGRILFLSPPSLCVCTMSVGCVRRKRKEKKKEMEENTVATLPLIWQMINELWTLPFSFYSRPAGLRIPPQQHDATGASFFFVWKKERGSCYATK